MIRWEIVHSLNDSITGRLTQSTALALDRSGAWSVGRSLARRIARSVYRCSARSALDTKSAQASVLVFKDDFEILSFSHLHARWSFCCAGNHFRAAKELSLILDWSFPGPRVENCPPQRAAGAKKTIFVAVLLSKAIFYRLESSMCDVQRAFAIFIGLVLGASWPSRAFLEPRGSFWDQ